MLAKQDLSMIVIYFFLPPPIHIIPNRIFTNERETVLIFTLAFFRVKWARMQRWTSAEQAARQRKASAAVQQSLE
jgi:hypothetical protein